MDFSFVCIPHPLISNPPSGLLAEWQAMGLGITLFFIPQFIKLAETHNN